MWKKCRGGEVLADRGSKDLAIEVGTPGEVIHGWLTPAFIARRMVSQCKDR